MYREESGTPTCALNSTLIGMCVGVWVTLITPKVNTYICVTHNKRVHTVTSEEVRRGKGEADYYY